MTAGARAGGALGPFPVGFSRVRFGFAGGFLFFALWSFGVVVAASFLLRRSVVVVATARRADIPPKASDYLVTLRMLAAVALVIAATFLRQTGSGTQASFYAVWLNGIGFSAGAIRLPIGIGNGVSAPVALSVGSLTRRVADYWLLIVSVGQAIRRGRVHANDRGLRPAAVAVGLRGAGAQPAANDVDRRARRRAGSAGARCRAPRFIQSPWKRRFSRRHGRHGGIDWNTLSTLSAESGFRLSASCPSGWRGPGSGSRSGSALSAPLPAKRGPR